MSKCIECGNELLTGDIHWEMGLCNNCYNKLYKDHKSHISLDKMWLEIANNFRTDNEKLQERIAELEEQLKNKPKYNIGDRVYIINEDYEVERDFIESIDIDTDGIEYYIELSSICFDDCQLFKTKAEAEAKLRELQGEKK